MEQEDKWTRFAATGRIEDYLDYRQVDYVSNISGKSSCEGGESGKSGLPRPEQKEQSGVIW